MYWLVKRDMLHKVCTVTSSPFLLTGTKTDLPQLLFFFNSNTIKKFVQSQKIMFQPLSVFVLLVFINAC